MTTSSRAAIAEVTKSAHVRTMAAVRRMEPIIICPFLPDKERQMARVRRLPITPQRAEKFVGVIAIYRDLPMLDRFPLEIDSFVHAGFQRAASAKRAFLDHSPVWFSFSSNALLAVR